MYGQPVHPTNTREQSSLVFLFFQKIPQFPLFSSGFSPKFTQNLKKVKI